MANISGANNEKVYTINKWLGLNEAPDGDTHLKLGEASKMVNWRITRDGNLKRRPGLDFVAGLCDGYSANISVNVTQLGTYSGSDKITIYSTGSVTDNPGIVVLGKAQQILKNGIFDSAGEVEDGVFTVDSDLYPEVDDGILSFGGGGEEVTFDQLYSILEELHIDDPSNFYGVYIDEIPYLINFNVIKKVGSQYQLGGYLITAVPTFGVEPIKCIWSGLVAGKKVLLAACDSTLWSLYDEDTDTYTRTSIGTISTDKKVSIFPFNGMAYILDGTGYYRWDGGNSITTVTGYIPIIYMGITPNGSASPGGEPTGEYVNLLTNQRKIWLSPDGNTNKTFQLPESAKSIDSVVYRDGSEAPTISTFVAGTDTITFTSDLTAGENTIEIKYSVYTHSDDVHIPDYKAQVTSNMYAELFSGNTDTGVFVYGNGTNASLYTGMNNDGMPDVEYFPDGYVVHVGDSNTPITGMIRHYGVLMCYKTDSAWALSYGTTTLPDGNETIAVYCTPVNRDKGNVAMGQVQLVNNNPVTCSGSELYQWVNSSYYTSNLTRDERQARRISDRVQSSIKELDFDSCCTWDDNDNQEYYISGNGITLVWNYATDTWYRYEGFNAACMCSFLGELYIGTVDGKILRLTDTKNGDEGYPVKAEWESGALDFGAGYQRKYSSMLWLGLKPQEGTSVDVCVETDRKNTFRDKVISSTKAKITGQPFMTKTKLKAKKFVYYRLLLSVDTKQPPVTVTDVEIRVRSTGYAK